MRENEEMIAVDMPRGPPLYNLSSRPEALCITLT